MTKEKKTYRIEIIIAAIAVIFGGGSFAGVKLLSTDDIKEEVLESVVPHEMKQDTKIEENCDKIKKQGIVLNSIIPTVEAIQGIQHKQFSQSEARRLTGGIRNRSKREENYDRLRELNMKRLKKGGDVCLTLECN